VSPARKPKRRAKAPKRKPKAPARRRDPRVVWRRRVVLGGAAVLALIALYMFWLRDSSLVAVDEVKVEGVTANAEQVTAALDAVGRDQTTLHVDEDELRKAVAGFPTVAGIDPDPAFPSTLTIRVTERLPVGVVSARGEAQGVSSEGHVLTGLDVSEERLPKVEARVEGSRLEGDGVEQTEVLGAAPPELLQRIDASTFDLDRGGVVIELDGGPELWFGDADDAEDKWQAAVTVLASAELGSPAYVDVSVPERVVTGG
jgi:cell division protein FtsQ